MARKRTEPLPSIGDAVEAIEDLARKYNLLKSGVSAMLSIVDGLDEKDRPKAALAGLNQLRAQVQEE